jgi:hypothetical protein
MELLFKSGVRTAEDRLLVLRVEVSVVHQLHVPRTVGLHPIRQTALANDRIRVYVFVGRLVLTVAPTLIFLLVVLVTPYVPFLFLLDLHLLLFHNLLLHDNSLFLLFMKPLTRFLRNRNNDFYLGIFFTHLLFLTRLFMSHLYFLFRNLRNDESSSFLGMY